MKWMKMGATGTRAAFGSVELRVSFSPLHISLLRDGRQEVLLNGRTSAHGTLPHNAKRRAAGGRCPANWLYSSP